MNLEGESPPITRLPFEILEAFIELSGVSTQLSLARVSRLFHSLTLRSLYCDISLHSPHVVVSCCRTLISRPGAAALVRSFLISYSLYSAKTPFASYYSLIRKALSSLSEVTTIRLLVHDPQYTTFLNHCTYPSLRHFECYLTLSDDLVYFLNRHPKITYLQVSPYENTAVSPEDQLQLPTVRLPSLQYFAGNGQSVPYLGTNSTLRAAIVTWDAVDAVPEVTISMLERSSRETLGLLSVRRRGWNLDLIEIISTRLPRLLSLHVSNVLMVDSLPSETYIETIRSLLPRFVQLQRLRINCVDYWEMGNISCQMDQDFTTVTDWGEACSSLVEITLPHSNGMSWFRLSGNLWIPDPRHTSGGPWLYDTVVLKRHPRWNSIVDGLKGRECSLTYSSLSGTSAAAFASAAFGDSIVSMRRYLSNLLRGGDVRASGEGSEDREEARLATLMSTTHLG
ncbi:hypothetical protein CVT24_008153 [Panaeolus cyanescens]|uniref:F-box domain-containing protein n=1 Tax=Panaeolus cyanescens TaxID=181874 RepID=A0A409VFD8_9AGAR|nr:hypothetical protein CVT24_008153 [Panaeolus cyanescens]